MSFEPAKEVGLGVPVDQGRGIVFTLFSFILAGIDITLIPPILTALAFTEPVTMALWILFSLFWQL